MRRNWVNCMHPSYNKFIEKLQVDGFKQKTDEEILNNLISKEEVLKHNTKNDLWVIYRNKIYDASKYQFFHPGGEQCFIYSQDQDITKACNIHAFINIEKYMRPVCIGILKQSAEQQLFSQPFYSDQLAQTSTNPNNLKGRINDYIH